MTVLAELSPLDPVTGGRVTLRAANSNDRDAAGWNGQRWFPAIQRAPKVGVTLFDAEFDGKASVSVDRIEIALDALRAARSDINKLVWPSAPVSIYRYAGSAASLVVKGRVTDFSVAGSILSLNLRVDDEVLAVPVLSATYQGNGGAEGAPELKGRPKPWLFGRAVNVEPVLIDAVDSVYQVSAYGPVAAITGCFERGTSFGAAAADYATYAALVGAAIQPGQWATCLAQGMVRLGAPATGVITLDADGDNGTGFLRKTGEILSRIADARGATAAVDAASLAAIDVAAPRNIALCLTEQVTLIDLAQRLAAPLNAAAGASLTGKLFIARVAYGTAATTLDAQGRQMPPVTFIGEEPVFAPYKRVMLGAARTWRVHGTDEIAFAAPLFERGLWEAATVYYEGNIVTRGDGSRWLYIATTGQAGITPGTNAAVWSMLAPAPSVDFYDPFNYATVGEFRAAWGGPSAFVGDGNISVIAGVDSPGGSCVEVGDNLGDDMLRVVSERAVPFDPEDLYEVGFDIEWLTAGATTYGYLGVSAMDASGANITSDNGSHCYTAAFNVLQNSVGRKTYLGYIRGRAAVGAGNNVGAAANDRAAPGAMPAGTVSISPVVLANYPNSPGRFRLHQAWLRKIADATLIATGPWSATRIYFRDEGVTYQGRSFGSKVDGNLNQVPPTTATSDANWYLVADKGDDGTSAYAVLDTNYGNHIVPADAGGNVLSYAGAETTLQVIYNGSDVSSSFGLTVATNPQALSYTIVDKTVAVTAGLDAAEPSASLLLRLTGTGAFAGIVLDRQFNLTKSRAGADGQSPVLVQVVAAPSVAKYNADNTIVAGDYVFTATIQNATGPVTWSSAYGHQIAGQAGVTINGNTLTITAARMREVIEYNLVNSNKAEETIIATVAGLSDRATVSKVRDGATGATGATGAPGAPGLNAYFHHAYADSADGTVNFSVGVPGGRAFQGTYSDNIAADSTNPASYQWAPYRGPATFGLVNSANCVIGPDFIQKVAGLAAWDAGAYATEAFVGGCSASFVVSHPGVMFGINTDPALDSNYPGIDYAFYLEGGGNLHCSESGTITLIGTWTVGDNLQIHYDGKVVRYLKNGVLLRTTSSGVPQGARFFLDTSIYAVGNRIEKIRWSAAGQAGSDGQTVAEVQIFQRSATVPTTPAGGSYDFSTKVLTPPAGWAAVPPAGTDPLYSAKGTAFVTGTTGTATPSWLGVGKIAQDGGQGADGTGVDVIFTRSAAQPTTPAPSTGAPTGWYTDVASVPASSDPLWNSFGQRPNASSNYTWDTPARVEGAPGANGISPVNLTVSPTSDSIRLDAAGVPKSGELPLTFGVKATKAGASIALTSITIVSSSGGTWDVLGNAVRLTALAGGAKGGECVFTVVAGGETLAGNTVSFSTSEDGAAVNQVSKSFTPTAAEANSTSMVQAGPSVAFNARADGTLTLNLTGSIKPNDTNYADSYAFTSKLQISTNGGTSWTDVTGSQADSTVAQDASGGEPGVPPAWTPANVNGIGPYSATGLGANAAVLIRVMMMIRAGFVAHTAGYVGSLVIFGGAG